MIESTLLEYLNDFSTVPWYAMRPKVPPEKYGLIDKTGATGSRKLTTSTIAFQSYAPTLLEAAEISAELRGLIEDSIVLGEIAHVELSSEYNFTNTVDKQPRYQAVYEIVHYE